MSFKNKELFIYSAALGLSCCTRDIPSLLWNVHSSVAAREHSAAQCGT